jgi:outer membrane protein assembly factor BamB
MSPFESIPGILQVELGDGSRVVLVPWEQLSSNADRVRRIFKYDSRGTLQWQVGSYLSNPGTDTLSNLYCDGNVLYAFNWNGGLYEIDSATGAVLGSSLDK